MEKKSACFTLIAPLGLLVDSITPTTVRVQFEKPEDAPGIDRYSGKVEGESLTIKCEVKSDAEPLECELEGLMPSTKHIVVGYVCLSGSLGCSKGVKKSSWTPPMGKII